MLTADTTCTAVDITTAMVVDKSILDAQFTAASDLKCYTSTRIVNPNQYWVGDPPPNMMPYIGDPPYNPSPGIIPLTVPYYPPASPWIVPPAEPTFPFDQLIKTIATTTNTYVDRWRVVSSGNTLKASLDVPGIRIADGDVEIESGVLRFTGKRFDTGATVNEAHVIGNDYDPETADAVIEAGVLTVTVERFKSKRVHKVALRDV